MSNDPNIDKALSTTPSPYEPPTSGAAEKPVEHDLIAPATEPVADQPVVRHRRSPFDASSPKPDEIWREHENRVRLGLPHASVAEICAEWKCEVPLEFDAPADGAIV